MFGGYSWFCTQGTNHKGFWESNLGLPHVRKILAVLSPWLLGRFSPCARDVQRSATCMGYASGFLFWWQSGASLWATPIAVGEAPEVPLCKAHARSAELPPQFPPCRSEQPTKPRYWYLTHGRCHHHGCMRISRDDNTKEWKFTLQSSADPPSGGKPAQRKREEQDAPEQ